MLYELLIKGGEMIDPKHGIHEIRDIAINQGKIAAIAKDIALSEAKEVIDAKNKIVTPGLIDLHTHVAEAIMPIALFSYCFSLLSSLYNFHLNLV